MYLQWAVAAVLIGVVYTWWAALAARRRLAGDAHRDPHRLRDARRFEASFHKLRRRRDYFRDLITAGAAGKEIRVFGLRDWLARRTTARPSLAALLPVWRSRRRGSTARTRSSSPVWLVLCAVRDDRRGARSRDTAR